MAVDIPSWVNIELAERILRLAETDNTIQVTDMLTEPASSKGDNYGSDMIRVTFEFTRKQDDKKVNDKKSMIFKCEPKANGVSEDMKAMHIRMFDTEIAMMIDSLEKMSAVLDFRLCARVFYVRLERPLCLIMEDLAARGFRMPDRTVGLDLAHCTLTIRTMAKFHASSIVLCEKEPKYKSVYCRGPFNKNQPKGIEQFFINASGGLASQVEKWPELGNRYADKIRNFIPKMYQKGIEASKCNDDEFNVINHGDCWINNMMYRYDENSKPVEHIFVDFQFSNYTSPAVDLYYFLATNPNEQVQLNNTEDLYEEYLRTLTTTMKQLGCKTLPPTMEELRKCLRERQIFGMILEMTLLPLLMLDKSEARDLEEMLAMAENPGVKNPVYRRIIIKKLQRYDKMGLLDL